MYRLLEAAELDDYVDNGKEPAGFTAMFIVAEDGTTAERFVEMMRPIMTVPERPQVFPEDIRICAGHFDRGENRDMSPVWVRTGWTMFLPKSWTEYRLIGQVQRP